MTRLTILPSLRILLPAALLALSVAAPGGTGLPSQDPSTSRPAEASPTADATGLAGLQVAVDPATGRLRPPTDEERRALGLALGRLANRSGDGLVSVPRPGGAQSIDLGRRFLNVSVATAAPDGQASSMCLTDAGTAARLLTAPSSGQAQASSPRRLEEK